MMQHENGDDDHHHQQQQQQQQQHFPPVSLEHEPNFLDDETMSLSDKLRTHYRKGSPTGSKAKIWARFMFQFQVITFAFMAFVYLSPWALADYDSITYLICNLFFVYIFIMCQSTWVYSIITESDLPETIPDIPPESSELDESLLQKLNLNRHVQSGDTNNSSNNKNTLTWDPSSLTYTASSTTIATTLPRMDKFGMIWKHCHDCNRLRPPRTYHCKFCRKCILRRDHHCHLVGKCIGHYNQRYFVVLCFWTMLASAIGFPITCSYLTSLEEGESWTWCILPYTFFLFLFRYISWKFALLMVNCYLMFGFGVMSLLYWLSQLSLISMGKTLVEVIKQMDVKVTSSLSENFQAVFGDNWFLSFILPVPVSRQTHDGIWFQKVRIYGKKTEDV